MFLNYLLEKEKKQTKKEGMLLYTTQTCSDSGYECIVD